MGALRISPEAFLAQSDSPLRVSPEDFLKSPAPASLEAAPGPDAATLANDALSKQGLKLGGAPGQMSRDAIPSALKTLTPDELNEPGTFQNPRTGRRSTRGGDQAVMPILDSPIVGGKSIIEGVEQMAQPEWKEKATGASKIVRGGLKAAEPLLPTALMAAPLNTIAGVGLGMATQTGVESGLKAVGVPPEYAGLAGDVAGLGAGVVGGHFGASLQARFSGAPVAPGSSINLPSAAEADALTTAAVDAAMKGKLPERAPQQAQPVAAPQNQTAVDPNMQPLQRGGHAENDGSVETVIPPASELTISPEKFLEEPPTETKPAHEPTGEADPHVEQFLKTAPSDSPLRGNSTKAKTAAGTIVDTHYEVKPVSELVASHDTALNENPDYPQELQPRDRTRKASDQQIDEIAGKLDPEELGQSYKASDGAPIVGPDNVVESGNGRTIAIRRLYERDHANGQTYRQWIIDNAEKFGIDPLEASNVKDPMLVRVRDSDVDRAQFAREANGQTVQAMSATEQAAADSPRLTGDLMRSFAPSEDGQVNTAGNRDFVRSFMDRVVSPAERNRYMTGEGEISQEGVNRIRNAVFHKAYGDTGTIEKMAESTDSNVRNITNGMLQAAPRFAKVAEGIAKGELHDIDFAPDVAAASEKLSALRDQGTPVDDYLKQGGLFGEDMTPESRGILEMMNAYRRSPKKLGGFLGNLANQVEAIGDPRQEGMFGTVKVSSKEELLSAAIRHTEKEYGQNSGVIPTASGGTLFEQGPEGSGNPEASSAGNRAQGEAAGGRGLGEGTGNAGDDGSVQPRRGRDQLEGGEETGPHGPVNREFAGRPREALDWVRDRKAGVAAGAIAHETEGDIGLPWGFKGTKAKNYKDGHGVSHIDILHKGYLDANVDRLASMPVIERLNDKAGRENGIVLSDGQHRAVVSKTWGSDPTEPWLLTAYDPSVPRTIVRVPEDPAGAAGPTPPETDGNSSITADAPGKQPKLVLGTGNSEAGALDLSGIYKALDDRFGNDGVKANYSGMGAAKDRFVRNLSQLEEASPEAHEATVRAAASKSQAAVLLRSAVPEIQKALGPDLPWEKFRTTLVESRLRGIRARWEDWARQSETRSADGFRKAFGNGLMNILEHIEGQNGIPQDVRETALALQHNLDGAKLTDAEQLRLFDNAGPNNLTKVDQLRKFLGDTFSSAARGVAKVMDPDEFDQTMQHPNFAAGLDAYKSLLEKPIAQNHALNEGAFSTALGPANTYYPLIPLEEAAPPELNTRARPTPFAKPKNIANDLATGLAPQYDLGAGALEQRLSRAIKGNNKAAMFDALEGAGLIRSLEPGERAGDVMEINGERYAAKTIELAEPRQQMVKGKLENIPAKFGVVPEWLHKELEPIVKRGDIRMSTPRKLLDAVTQIALTGPTDAVFHATNLLGTMVANTPFIGDSLAARTVGNLPFAKAFTSMIKIVSTDPATPEASANLMEMARAGVLPDKFGSVTYSRQFAEQTGAELKRFSPSPLLYGPKGLDVRARLVMWRMSKELGPNDSLVDRMKFVNQLGNYVTALQGPIERSMKESVAPFYTAGSTMYRNGLNAVLGTGPIPGNRMEYRVAQQLSGGLIGTAATWMLAHRAMTGKWPWDDPKSKFMKVPVPEWFRRSSLGLAIYGKNRDTGYVNLAAFNPLLARGARATGMAGAYDMRRLGGNGKQQIEAAIKDMGNSVIEPATTGPLVKAGSIMATGNEPYATSLQPFRTLSATDRKKHGAAMMADRAKESVLNMNSFFQNLGAATGLGHKSDEIATKGNRWLRMATSIALPRLLTQSDVGRQRTAVSRDRHIIDRDARK